MRNRIIGNIEIKRKDILYEQLMQNYNKKEIDISQEEIKPTNNVQLQNPYENMIIHEFNNNVQIYKNGQKVEKNNYYNDFNSNNNSIYTTKQPVQVSNESIEQVDPVSFFGNSLNGVINKIKK